VQGVPQPIADINEVRGAYERLHRTVVDLEEATLQRPSGLPGWSVGHVITHLARNADSVVRRLEASERGERVEQYPGGARGRADEIERGTARSAASIVKDLIAADERVERTFAAVSPAVWDQQVAAGNGKLVVASHLAFARWREVEIHHVDLGVGYSTADWSDVFVERMLPRVLDALPGRCDRRVLLGWTLGRDAAPALNPWG
jgi:maleylpyruvate isomerase